MNWDLSGLDPDKIYVMGVSGGPDSMAVAHYLSARGFHLVLCTVNYHRRPDSDWDVLVVRDFAKQHHLPVAVFDATNPAGNFQAWARQIRYDFFVKTCFAYHAAGIITAHQRDDNLENILLRKKRQDLWRIPSPGVYHGFPVYRPAINIAKKELEDYCRSHDVTYRVDSSNLGDDYSRNVYRHHVLPDMSEKEKTDLLLEAEKHDEKYLDDLQAARERLPLYLKDGQLSLKVRDDPLCLFLLRVYLEGQEITQSKLLAFSQFLFGDKDRGQFVWGPDLTFMKADGAVYVKHEDYSYEFSSGQYGEYPHFEISKYGPDRCGINLLPEDFPVTVRTRRAGDKISLTYGTKKLSRLFIDGHIPSYQRELWPVVESARGEILLVPFLAKNKDYCQGQPTWFCLLKTKDTSLAKTGGFVLK